MTNKPIMQATDLSRHYRQGDVTLSVLSGVNLRIKVGEKIAIVGVSGLSLIHIWTLPTKRIV